MKQNKDRGLANTNWPEVCNTIVKEMSKYGPFGIVVILVLVGFFGVIYYITDFRQQIAAYVFLGIIFFSALAFYTFKPIRAKRRANRRITAVVAEVSDTREAFRARRRGQPDL